MCLSVSVPCQSAFLLVYQSLNLCFFLAVNVFVCLQGGAGENLFSTFSILETRLSGAPAAAGTHSDGQSPSLAVVGPSPGLLIGQRECFRQRADFELAKFRRNFGEILPKIWQRQKFAKLLPKFPRKFAKILAQSFCRSFAENLAKSLPKFCRNLGES